MSMSDPFRGGHMKWLRIASGGVFHFVVRIQGGQMKNIFTWLQNYNTTWGGHVWSASGGRRHVSLAPGVISVQCYGFAPGEITCMVAHWGGMHLRCSRGGICGTALGGQCMELVQGYT